MANGKNIEFVGPAQGGEELTVLWANKRWSQEKYYAKSGLTDGLRNAKHGKELKKKKCRAEATRIQNIHRNQGPAQKTRYKNRYLIMNCREFSGRETWSPGHMAFTLVKRYISPNLALAI
jgi:hypothetical protein